MPSMGIKLKKIRIMNLRSIKEMELDLDDCTILFGLNNSGKSNFLYGIFLALGRGTIDKDDVYHSEDFPFTTSTTVKIDLLFYPVDESGQKTSSFNDRWNSLLGILVGTDGIDEYFGIRVTYAYDDPSGTYAKKRYVIRDWDSISEKTDKPVYEKVMDCFDCIYVDAQRDISLDIRDRTSFWNKRISNMPFSDDLKDEYASSVKKLNQLVIDQSESLQNVRDNLTEVIKQGDVKIDLIPEDVAKIHRGLEINIISDRFVMPISHMGLGTRSQAVFNSIKTITNDNIADPRLPAYYCIVLAEEPESHLHPCLQRALMQEFEGMMAQRIITTHSPFLISQSRLEDLVSCSNDMHGSNYTSLKTIDRFGPDCVREIRRMFLSGRADALFSDLVILGEGITECEALPVYFKEYFGKTPDEMNVSIVGVGGKDYYAPCLYACNSFNISWLLLSDGESDAKKAVDLAIDKVFGEQSYVAKCRVFTLSDGNCYEKHILNDGYYDLIETFLRDDYSGSFDGYMKKQRGNGNKNDQEILYKLMHNNTAYYTKSIAEAICSQDVMKKIPSVIINLLKEVEKLLGE